MRRYENATGEEGNREPSNKVNFPRNKLRALSLVSATLEIEHATQQLAQNNTTEVAKITINLYKKKNNKANIHANYYSPFSCTSWCKDRIVTQRKLFFFPVLEEAELNNLTFFSELCGGKAVVAYTKPQQRKKERKRKANRRERSDQVYWS